MEGRGRPNQVDNHPQINLTGQVKRDEYAGYEYVVRIEQTYSGVHRSRLLRNPPDPLGPARRRSDLSNPLFKVFRYYKYLLLGSLVLG